MPNTNSVAGIATAGTIRNTFPVQSIATTAETIFTVNTDTGTANYFQGIPTGTPVRGANTKIDVNANPATIGHSKREYGLPSGESTDQFSSSSWDGRPFKVRITGKGVSAAQLAAPVNDTFTTATTGGTLLDTTAYFYRVAAVNAQGGTSLASAQTSITTGNSTANTNTVTVKWLAVAGAVSYNVYGRTTGGELFMANVAAPTLQFVDDGSITPAGALPTSATSAVTIQLYQGLSATLGSDKSLGTTGAVPVSTGGGNFNFELEATLMWDATSQILSGSYTANVGYGSSSSFTTDTVVTNVVTALPLASLSFLGTATFGFASSANTIQLEDFSLDRI